MLLTLGGGGGGQLTVTNLTVFLLNILWSGLVCGGGGWISTSHPLTPTPSGLRSALFLYGHSFGKRSSLNNDESSTE